MTNPLIHIIAKFVVFFSYTDVIVNFILNENRLSVAILFASIIFLYRLHIGNQNRKEDANSIQIKLAWTDLITTILFCYRIKSNITILIQIPFLQEQKIIDISNYSSIVILAFFILTVLNELATKYGWGLTRIFRTFGLWIKYTAIYALINMHRDVPNYLKNKFDLTIQEKDILKHAAKWKKEKKNGSFPIYLRVDAEKRGFLNRWLYNISLVNGQNIQLLSNQKTNRQQDVNTVKIDLTSSKLAIINNEGKMFLKTLYDGDNNQRITMKNNNMVTFDMLKSDRLYSENKSLVSADVFYRWGSAGVLPIIEWKNEKWIAFVYRDIYPKGWNLPLGATESELEKGRPGITAIRELLEEIIISENNPLEYADGNVLHRAFRRELYHPLLNSIASEVNYRASKRQFYQQQNDIISQTYTFNFEEHYDNSIIDCIDEHTSMQIEVTDHNRKNLMERNLSTNCFVVVDCFEQAIECIKPVSFSIDERNELRMGEVDYVEEKWINNPVILIKYEKLKEYFSESIKYNCKDNQDFGEGLYLDLLEDQNNYHLFGVNISDRISHLSKLKQVTPKKIEKLIHKKKYRRIEAQIEYLENFVSSNKKFFSKQNFLSNEILSSENTRNNPGYYLCPVSWKSLSYYFLSTANHNS